MTQSRLIFGGGLKGGLVVIFLVCVLSIFYIIFIYYYTLNLQLYNLTT